MQHLRQLCFCSQAGPNSKINPVSSHKTGLVWRDQVQAVCSSSRLFAIPKVKLPPWQAVNIRGPPPPPPWGRSTGACGQASSGLRIICGLQVGYGASRGAECSSAAARPWKVVLHAQGRQVCAEFQGKPAAAVTCSPSVFSESLPAASHALSRVLVPLLIFYLPEHIFRSGCAG